MMGSGTSTSVMSFLTTTGTEGEPGSTESFSNRHGRLYVMSNEVLAREVCSHEAVRDQTAQVIDAVRGLDKEEALDAARKSAHLILKAIVERDADERARLSEAVTRAASLRRDPAAPADASTGSRAPLRFRTEHSPSRDSSSRSRPAGIGWTLGVDRPT